MKARNASRPQWPKTLPQTPKFFIEETSILPEETRDSHQQYLNSLKRLCANPVFRECIINLRKKYPTKYWGQVERWRRLSSKLHDDLWSEFSKITDRFWKKYGDVPVVPSFTFTLGGQLRFEVEAEGLCEQCGLRKRDWRWIEWLVCNWDPNETKTPREAPPDLAPSFYPWRITVMDFFPLRHRRVTVELEEGASPKAASKAAARAVKELPATYSRHAPPINDTERQELHRIFKSEFANNKLPTQTDFKNIAQYMSTNYWSISAATIRKEYFVFTGVQPRQYAGVASRDRRK